MWYIINFHIEIFSSETTENNYTKLGLDGHWGEWGFPFQIVSDNSALLVIIWQVLLKIEISLSGALF